MSIKKKYWIFDIFKGTFVKEQEREDDYCEYAEILKAEKQIAREMIKQKLDKINPEDYDESRA